jgi:valyl-tRNA synthetase
MSKEYRPSDFERRHYERWESANYFAPSGHGEAYCIVIPPPNVTGTLHMGHAFGHTIKDALIRYHRMLGRDTLWQPGTDHAGIATQIVVERMLEKENISRTVLGRDQFVDRVWDWKQRSGDTISTQMRRLGDSVDWSRERFTMDPDLSSAVTEVFVKLHEEGLIYRGKRLVNWDPTLHTAVSDLEVVTEEEHGSLWRFRYPIVGSAQSLVVATTRPETMFGDTAVAVHPEDERYKQFIGSECELPLTGRTIPIIADEYVDPEFGTGCVKITPAHDFNDYEVGRRHDLSMINIFNDNAALNENVPAEFQNLDRFEARKRAITALEVAGLLDGIEDHRSMIPRCERTNTIVEPYLTDQWYVKVAPLAEPAIAAVENGSIRFVPEHWSKTYFEWMRNIQDWCISRQLWWGHRIPAWYDDDGNIYVGRSESEAREKHGLGSELALRQDEDVLDTWFSSALWPFSTLGWPQEDLAFKQYYPTAVLVTGFDIIFFWVARMIMMGLKFAGNVPFRDVYIHGLVRDHEGQKMSKSKGNILDPLDLIDGVDLETLIAKRTESLLNPRQAPSIEAATRKEFPDGIRAFGTDALRMTFASLATMGRDIRFDIGRIDGYHKFCNKLWNASHYVLTQLEQPTEDEDDAEVELTLADRWIQSRLVHCLKQTHDGFSNYRVDLASQALYDFTWHEFCDWYLELTKPVLSDDTAPRARKRGTQQTLTNVLAAILKALHPLMPFISEELWLTLNERIKGNSATIMLEAFPLAQDFASDAHADSEIEWLKAFIIGVRQIRGEMNISPGRPLSIVLAGHSAADRERTASNRHYIDRLARISSIDFLAESQEEPSGAAVALLGEMRILVPLTGLVDIAKEVERLKKQADKTSKDLKLCSGKLSNARFVDNAPADVVQQERDRVAALAQRLEQLEEQLAKLQATE